MSPLETSKRILELQEQQQPITDSIHASMTVVEKIARFFNKYWYILALSAGLFSAGADWGLRSITKQDNQKNIDQNIIRTFHHSFDSLKEELRVKAIEEAFNHRLERKDDSIERAQYAKEITEKLKNAVLTDLDGKLIYINGQISRIQTAIKLTDGYNEVKTKDGIILKPAKEK